MLGVGTFENPECTAKGKPNQKIRGHQEYNTPR